MPASAEVSVDPTKKDIVSSRLASSASAQGRARTALLAASIVSLSASIASYNAFFSWYRKLAFSFGDSPVGAHETTLREVLRKEMLLKWIQSRMVSNGFLGIQVGADDLIVLSGFSLLVISCWMYLTSKRAHLEIAYLLRDTKDESTAFKDWIFHSIVASMVVTPVFDEERPFVSLTAPAFRRPIVAGKIIATFFAGLPALAMALITSVDMYAMYMLPSPFRASTERLWMQLGPEDRQAVVIRWAVAWVLTLATGTLCLYCLQFIRANGKLIVQYRQSFASEALWRDSGLIE